LPYESVSQQIGIIAHRTSLDSLVFPVDALLPLVCAYAVSNGQDASIGADPSWPVLLFLNLGVPHALVAQVLENMFDAQEAPFTGRRRRAVVQWIVTVVDAWVRDVERRGAVGKGGADAAMGAWVAELLARADESLVVAQNGAGAEVVDLKRAVQALKKSVDAIVGADPGMGSFIFR
jgi:nuclear pore complex protein Nup155